MSGAEFVGPGAGVEQVPGPRVGTTHVLLVVDRSGSMSHLEQDVREAFNSFVGELRSDGEVTYRLTVMLFNDTCAWLALNAPLDGVPELTTANYRAGGMTALFDAIGKTIAGFEDSTLLQDGDRVMLVIQTDGFENASREYRSAAIAQMISEREASGRWTAVYLGAGRDAWNGGGQIGTRSVNTGSDAGATRSAYGTIAEAARGYARGATGAQTFTTLSGLSVDDAGTPAEPVVSTSGTATGPAAGSET